MSVVPEIRIAQNDQEWAEIAKGLIYDIGAQAIKNRGRFVIALSGGKTPELLYKKLSSSSSHHRLDWSRTLFLFSDERCVPPDHPASNFSLADRALFRPLSIHPDQIHRMVGEDPDPERAANNYEHELRRAIGNGSIDWPCLDLVLLGIGSDGHTASLFPGTLAVEEHHRWVARGEAPSGPTARLTLTLGVLNRASVVLFLVTGTQKAAIVKSVLEPSCESDRRLPAAQVKPEHGRLIWLFDVAASAKLKR